MNDLKNYKKEYKQLDRLPDGIINLIYIIPSKMYNRFLG